MAECKPLGAPVTIPDYMRGASASVLTPEVVVSLAQDLEGHRLQLANQLGFSRDCLLSDGLNWWRRNPGSTVHVLSCILTNLNKIDCLHKILEDMEHNTMQLYIKLEYSVTDSQFPCRPQFQQVTTNTEFPLREALWVLLGGDLSSYRIMGPGSWVSWSTPAKELRGQQLTLLHHSASEDTDVKTLVPFKSNISQHSQSSGYSVFRTEPEEHTKMEELKYIPMASIISDSNNVTACSSVDCANYSIFANAPSSQTLSLSSVDNNNVAYSQNGLQGVKNPLSKENTDQKSQQCKTFRDKSFFQETNTPNVNLLSQCNVPNFSMIDTEQCSGMFPQERNIAPQSSAPEEKQNNLSFKGRIRTEHCEFQNNLEPECDLEKWTMMTKLNEAEPFKIQDMNDLESNMDMISEGDDGGGDVCQLPKGITNGDSLGTEYVTHSFIEKWNKIPVSQAHSPPCSSDPPQKKHRMSAMDNQQSADGPLPRQHSSVQQGLVNLENQGRLDEGDRSTEHHAKTSAPSETSPSNLYRYTPPPPFEDEAINTDFQGASKSQSCYPPREHSRPVLSERQPQTNAGGPQGEQHYMVMQQPHSLIQALTNSQEVGFHHRREQSLPNGFPQHPPHQPVHLVAYRPKAGNPRFLSGTNSSGVFSCGTQGSSTEYSPDGIKYTSLAVQSGHQTFHDAPADLFQMRPLTHDALGRPMGFSADPGRRDELQGDRLNTTFRSDDEQRYNYIDGAQVGVGTHSNRGSSSLQEDLARLEAWCPNLNGDMVLKEMQKYLKRDGVYVIWRSKRMNKFILTISHQQELIHLQINEANRSNEGVSYFLYENGFNSDRLYKLIDHYKQNGVRIAVRAMGGNRIHNENISLKFPLKV